MRPAHRDLGVHRDLRVLAECIAQHRGKDRELEIRVLFVCGQGERRPVERNGERRPVEDRDDAAALGARQRVEQLDDVGDLLGEAHAAGAVEETVALGLVDVERGELREREPGEQHQHEAPEQAFRRQAHQRSIVTGAAST